MRVAYLISIGVAGGARRATPAIRQRPAVVRFATHSHPPRRGLVLLLVLVVIAMLSLGAYSFTNLMLAHHEAAIATGRQVQARSLVDSGVTATQLFLSQPEADRLDAGGIFDNPQRFRGIVVLQEDDPLARGC